MILLSFIKIILSITLWANSKIISSHLAFGNINKSSILTLYKKENIFPHANQQEKRKIDNNISNLTKHLCILVSALLWYLICINFLQWCWKSTFLLLFWILHYIGGKCSIIISRLVLELHLLYIGAVWAPMPT